MVGIGTLGQPLDPSCHVPCNVPAIAVAHGVSLEHSTYCIRFHVSNLTLGFVGHLPIILNVFFKSPSKEVRPGLRCTVCQEHRTYRAPGPTYQAQNMNTSFPLSAASVLRNYFS